MKQVFWFLCASIVSTFIGGSLASVAAQVSSPTPDPFVVQLTQIPNSAFKTAVGDMSANGRFVVFVSNADLSTEKDRDGRNNADGNREIFLIDYAQRRIFQITNTRHVLNPPPTASPTPTPSPTPSPSPTPTPAATPADLTQVKIDIDNGTPMISLAPPLVNGQRVYRIVFSSNAPDPENFNGIEPDGYAADANSEIWIYRLPGVTDVDLTLGADLPLQDLAVGGEFFRVTNTAASRASTAGSSTKAPFFADDNREPAISDDGNIIAFISTRSLPNGSTGNADANPELYFYNRTSAGFTQATTTQDPTPGFGSVFQSNPSLSATGLVVAFTSSANLSSNPNVPGNNPDLNAEIYTLNFNGSAVSGLRQVTRTQNAQQNTNVASPGRRLSRDGGFIAFESRAIDPKANAVTTSTILGSFVYTVATDTFVEVGPRALSLTDVAKFPTFTDYNAALTPSSVVFVSALNFRTDGTFPPSAQDTEGLNPQRAPQMFLTALPALSTQTFTRLTNVPGFSFQGLRPVASETRKRMAFSLADNELGGGNADSSTEIFYLLTPQVTVQSNAVLSFFTGASNMPVSAATPGPTPNPSPTPTPSPTPAPSPIPGQPFGVAPGELTIVRSTIALAPSNASAGVLTTCCSETTRSPALPVELNGVSVSVNGHAAGLYFVGNAEKQINFVMPIGLAGGVATVAVNVLDAGANTDTLLRGFVQIILAQPDILVDADGRAAALNAVTQTKEPFSVTTNGAPTVIQLTVTGLRLAQRTDITVTVGTTTISGDGIVSVLPQPDMPGFEFINFTLPPSLAGAGDVPVQVTFTRSGFTTVSRPAATAPRITIN